MADADPHLLRTTFDESPELYDRARPVAPPQLFDDLAALSRLGPGARLVEIGCGTGQATLPLAERGFRIVAVELGKQLADFTRRRLARYDRVSVVNSSFEAWDHGGERFDGVVSFNAFHWIDPAVRFAKPAAILRPGGALAIAAMHFVTPDDADSTWIALQDDYDAVLGPTGKGDPPPHPDAVTDLGGEIEASGFFRTVSARRYEWTITYTASDYLAHLRTTSWHKRLQPEARHQLFRRVYRRILTSPDRTLDTPVLATLDVAERI